MKSKILRKSLFLAFFIAIIKAFCGIEILFALITALAAHELGHILVIYLLGNRVTCINLELSGLKIEYSDCMTARQTMFTALAGPVVGVISGVLAMGMYNKTGMIVLKNTAEYSFLLSAFNMLPIFPLDGGNALLAFIENIYGEQKAIHITHLISLGLIIILFFIGLVFLIKGEGNGLFVASLWLLLLQG